MQHRGRRAFQFAGQDTVRAHLQKIDPRPVALVDLLDLLKGRAFQTVDAAAAEHLDDDAVHVFRTGTDDNLFRFDIDPAASGQIAGQGLPQFPGAVFRTAVHDSFVIDGNDLAHRAGKDGERKRLILIPALGQDHFRQMLCRGNGKRVLRPVRDKDTAALPGFNIAFIRQDIVGMLDRDHTDPGLLGQQPLRGQPAAMRQDPVDDILADLPVQLQVCLSFFFRYGIFHLVILFYALYLFSSRSPCKENRKNAARVRCQYERAVTAVKKLKKPKERFQTADNRAARSGRGSFVSFMR